jgi:hypothetical protein
MKFFTKAALGLCLAASTSFGASAIGWPANYQGVMLQGFYWDSYSDTKWATLESQADELSQYFKLIWVPNSGSVCGGQNMGYAPVYWFTNHNTCFGTEAQLRSMIATYKAKGVGIIEDVVINHRSGVSNWTNFPSEVWNGQTWHIGLDGICCTDEVNNESSQQHGTGAADTGEDFAGSRDLDHTNANVQNNCKNYCKFLLEDLGYVGFRYDMCKGYSGQYNKIYNQYAKPTYSVGEYWDGSYDALAAWIESTGKESAAFDFACKYALNNAFSYNDMTKLCWKANGTTDQPAGLIHYGYSQLAVTFVDNHDTYRDSNKFTGDVVAANAFILMSPGTPCIFLPHYKQYKSEIQTLINIRNSVGIHNNSAVTVLQSSRDCYMAEITGTNGKAVVKIGSAMTSPSGYSDSDIKASGNNYCVWTKTEVQGGTTGGGGGTTGSTTPDKLYLMGNLAAGSWQTNVGVELTKTNDKYFIAKNVELVAADEDNPNAYFSFVTVLGTTGATTEWDEVINGSDRYGATSLDAPITVGTASPMQCFEAYVNASSAYAWSVTPGTYNVTVDFNNMTVTLTTGDDMPDIGGGTGGGGSTTTDGNYVYYDNSVSNWSSVYCHYWGGATDATWPGSQMTLVSGNIYKYEVPEGTTGLVFNCGTSGTGNQTSDFVCTIGHIYNMNGDQGVYNAGGTGGGGGGTGDDTGTGVAPDQLYVIGNLAEGSWLTNVGVEMTKSGDTYTGNSVTFVPASDDNNNAYFSFVTVLGTTGETTEWDEVINGSDRYGAATSDAPISLGQTVTMRKFAVGVDASSTYAWVVAPGTYSIVADFANMTVTLAQPSGVEAVTEELNNVAPVYYNLQGMKVTEPTSGIYIVVRGTKVTKEIIR